MRRAILELSLLPSFFEPCGDLFTSGTKTADRMGYLKAVIQIGGALHHLELIEVYESDGEQWSALADLQPIFNELLDHVPYGRVQTIELDGRRYVPLLVPFEA